MLYIGADHRGFHLKKYLLRYLKNQLKIKPADVGAAIYDAEDDFPDFAIALAKKVAKSKAALGILICGTGHGVCIAANKVKGVRAAAGYSIEAAERARKEDNVNVLCLAGRFLSEEHAAAIVKIFLANKFDPEEKRVRRLKKIAAVEQ